MIQNGCEFVNALIRCLKVNLTKHISRMKKMYARFIRIQKFSLSILLLLLFITTEVFAGGPWVIPPGQLYLTAGFSRKVGKERYTHFHLDPNNTPKNYNDDVDSFALVTPPDSTTVDGKFHDFRYYYFQGQVGICKNLELDWTLNWLEGREAQRSGSIHG